jgi:hypothetical protein
MILFDLVRCTVIDLELACDCLICLDLVAPSRRLIVPIGCSTFVLMEVETLGVAWRGALDGRCICAAPTAISWALGPCASACIASSLEDSRSA